MNPPVPEDTGQPGAVLVHGVRETLPLVVRLNPWRYAWAGTRYALTVFLLMASPFVVLFLIVKPLFFWLPLLIVPLGLLRFPHLFIAARRGPVLGADEAGIWLRLVYTRKAVFLPWPEVFVITVEKTFGHVELCARPRDLDFDAYLAIPVRGFGDVRQGQRTATNWMRVKLGTNVHTPLTGGDVSVEEVLTKLRQFSAGRCPVRVYGPLPPG